MLRNCPLEYYNNCAVAGKDCRICSAGSGPKTNRCLYRPLVPAEHDCYYHPLQQPDNPIVVEKEKRKKTLRRARATERAIEQEIIKGTLRSGAALGDGDHLLLGAIRQEVKDRGSRSSWNLTWEEYTKGCRQGIQAYAISILPPSGPRKTMYMMEEHVFTALLASIQASQHE